MKLLVVYYSLTGNNDALAQKIIEGLDCDVFRIQTARKRTKLSVFLDLILKRSPKLQEYSIRCSDYDHLIFIAPVWAGRVATPMQTFFEKEKQNILKYSFITLCGGVAGQKQKIAEYLTATLQHKPVAVEELWVSDLLLAGQKDNDTTHYSVRTADLYVFKPEIDAFLKDVACSTERSPAAIVS